MAAGDRAMFDVKQQGVRGTFGIANFCVTAEMQITLKKYNRGASFNLAVGTAEHRYLVPQLQSSSNFCELAMEEMEDLCNDPIDMRHASRMVDTIWDYVRQARGELRHPSRSIFPRSCHPSVVFCPELPPDLALDFSVQDGLLIVTLLALTTAIKPNQSGGNESDGAMEGFAVGQTMYYKGAWVEVLEFVEHTYQMKQLDSALDSIEHVWHSCNQLRDHFASFNAMQ